MRSNNKAIDPRSRAEKEFIDMHVTQRLFNPEELDNYFDNEQPEKDYTRLADYQDGEDIESYMDGFAGLKGQIGSEIKSRMEESFIRIVGENLS